MAAESEDISTCVNPLEWKDQMQTIQVMAEKRGYQDFESLVPWQKLNSDIYLTATARETNRQRQDVYFILVSTLQLSVKSLRQVQKWTLDQNASNDAGQSLQVASAVRVVVISQKGLTPFADKELQKSRNAQPFFEVFTKVQLAFPVVHHRLVPSHEAMSPRSTLALLHKHKCILTSFPKIHLNDPVVRFMGFTRGTMLKITRCLGNLEPQLWYRLVV
jgi:DNA-directed RNA polymerase subunit H (RpoH/RPB5)